MTLPGSGQAHGALVSRAHRTGVVLAREVLLEKVWGYEFAGDSRAVDVHIRWLRGKIERDPADPRHIITVRGVGYRFEEETKMCAGCRHTVPRT